MTKKKTTASAPVRYSSPALVSKFVGPQKSVRLYVDVADHRILRRLAFEAGLPMSDFVRRLVEQEIRRSGIGH